MSNLPPRFTYSQSNLQDYLECPRRFQLSYVEAQSWPAVAAAPVQELERYRRMGERFHRLVERHQLGLNPDQLSPFAQDDPDLYRWWLAYRGLKALHTQEGNRLPEYTLTAPFGNRRMMAKYDLLVVQPSERITIYDWKTTRRRPNSLALSQHVQTRVYRYVLATSGSLVSSDPDNFSPDAITMIYWFPEYPAEPVEFPYSTRQFDQDRVFLTDLCQQIESRDPESIWPLTPHTQMCRFCEYRSLCDRGVEAGVYSETDATVVQSQMELEAVLRVSDLGLDDVEEVGF